MLFKNPVARAEAITLATVSVCGFAVSGLGILKPLIVGGLIRDYHFTAQQAGLVAGSEMFGIALASLLLAVFGSSWNRRHVVIAGATLGILGSLGPVLSSEFLPILVSRIVAGAGCGIAGSVMLSMIGAMRSPDRSFGVYYATIYVGASGLVVVGAWAIGTYQVSGGYVLLALLLICIYFAAVRVPARFGGATNEHNAGALPPFPLSTALISLSGYFLICCGMGGTWAFIERIGDHNGLSAAAVAGSLAIGPYASVAGALTAAALRTRFGRTAPTVTSIALVMVSAVLLTHASTDLLYMVGVLLFSFVWSLFFVCLGGLLAAQDRAGRVISMSISSQTLGMALGPAAAGFVVSRFGYEAIALMALAFYAAGLAFLLRVLLDPAGHERAAPMSIR